MDVSASAPGAEPLIAPTAAVKESDSGRSRSRSPARLNSKNMASPSGGAAQTTSPRPAAAVVSPASNLAAARPSTASSSSAGAGIAGVALPPAIVDLSRKLERSRSASRFPAVRSSTFTAVSWVNPLFSGALLLGLLGLWTAASLADASLPAIASNLALLGLLGGGAIAAYNWQAASSGRPPLPVALSLPIAARDVEGAIASIGAAAGGAIASLNFLLSWREPVASLRALAYAWLLSRFAFLLSPGWLVTFALLAFAAAPSYLLNAPMIDALYTTQLLPKANAAAAAVRTQRDTLLALVSGPSAQVYGIVAIVGATVLGYMAWDWFTFTGIATLLTLVLAAHDALMAVATGNAVAAGSATSAARRTE